MASTLTPVQATCCRCQRTFPVKAVMSLPNCNIPLLVVLSEVTSVEEAMKLATCQVCLEKKGASDRGLHAILTLLGCKDASVSVSMHLDQRVFLGNRQRQVVPSMSGVRVVMKESLACYSEPKLGSLVIVVRVKSDLPRVANEALKEPEEPCPKIVYPKDGQYGTVFTVQGSRRKPKQSYTRALVMFDLACWAADHPESAVSLDIMCSYLEFFLDGENEVASESEIVPSSQETQPHAEV